MIFTISPPDQVIDNYEAIKAWIIDIGIGLAVVIAFITLAGWKAYKKARERRNPTDEESDA